MKTEFTKEEWAVGFEDFTSSHEVPYIEINCGEKLIAKSIYGKDTEQRLANAKLIAAAPELLKALIHAEKALGGIDGYMSEIIEKSTGVDSLDVYCECRELIHKITS